MTSSKNTARLAGLLWVLTAVTAGFSLVYVRPKLIVFADAATTVKNIIAFESLFRAGIASSILSQIFAFFFGLTIFRLFKGVNKTLAMVFLTSLLVGVGVWVVNSLSNLGGYLPRVIGILLIIGACAFPINTFTKILIPQFYPALMTRFNNAP
jgi:uncharacterized protein DUF4386